MNDPLPFQPHDQRLQPGVLSSALATEGGEHREDSVLQHLHVELRFLNRVLNIERERVAQLAETWGHRTFAQFLRERMKQENLLQDQSDSRHPG